MFFILSLLYCIVTILFGVYLVLWLFYFAICGVCMCGFCNVWICGFCNMWMCVCVGFVTCGRVYVWVL